MSKGVAITYGDVAVGAKENSTITVSEKKFHTINNLKKYNMKLYNYANPCELYQTVLDGNPKALSIWSSKNNIGLWSVALSKDDGTFETPIFIELETSGQYSTQGFTLTFDKFNNIYATDIEVNWYRKTGDNEYAAIASKSFTPNSPFYFCRNQVENFDRVTFLISSINMPKNRLKVEAIDWGYGTVFLGDELRSAKISQSISPLSTEIPINTCDFTLDSKTDMEYSFQTKQPISISYNDNLIMTSFVKSSKRKGKFLWDVKTEDYIGTLENSTFVGGIYSDATAYEIFESIFKSANVLYSIDNNFKTVKLSGYIPYTTGRNALMQVAFASQAAIITSGESIVHVTTLSDEVKYTIPKSRIMQGQTFENSNVVTRVELTCHSYTCKDEIVDAYKAEDSGTGENILVKFSEPLTNLTITNGTIIKSGTNYAIINANKGCVLTGNNYYHYQTTDHKNNPLVLTSETPNVKSIKDATLISYMNIDNVLQKCYNYLTKTDTTNLKIVEGKNVTYGSRIKYGNSKYGQVKYGGYLPDTITYDSTINLGDMITCDTQYLGQVTGRVIKQTFSLKGNIIVKETVLK